MRVIDKTPLINENGEFTVTARVQGIMRYGFSWFADLEAQEFVIARLSRQLERGYVLIRNFTLPNSEIMIPLALLGPAGIQILYATGVRGFFSARGGDWNAGHGTYSRPARPNLLMRVVGLARAFQVYLQRQDITLLNVVEPVLIAADPGAHIEQLRPVCRVVQSDAINAFAQSLLQARPVFETPLIHDMADRIVNPRPPSDRTPIVAGAEASLTPTGETPTPSRARAIFEASDAGSAEAREPAESSELSFAFEGEQRGPLEVPAGLQETSPSQQLADAPIDMRRRPLGMTAPQLIFLGLLVLVEVCILAGFATLVTIGR